MGFNTYAAGFQLTSAGADTFSHDANGRIDSMTRGGATTALTYSSTDHVTSVTTGAAVSSYEYDAAGRRVAVVDVAGSRNYLVAPSIGQGLDSPHLVLDGTTGAPIANYIYGGEHALMRISGASAEYYLEDAMGSVIGIANAAGALSQSIEYDSFGNVLNGAALPSDTAGEFRFHGMWLEPTGLYHVRARHYDATTGRFVSRDPALGSEVRPESWQSYMFANNNGGVFRDPTGQFSLTQTQVTQTVQGILNRTARKYTGKKAKTKAREGITQAVVDAATRKLESVIPFNTGIDNLRGESKQPGDILEEIVMRTTCTFLNNFGTGSAGGWVWKEPEVKGDGSSAGGQNCQKVQGTEPTGWNSGQQLPNPDFLVSSVEPAKLQERSLTSSRHSYVIGDVKMKAKNIKHNSGNTNQFAAMAAHAKGYSWTRLVVYITLRSDARAKILLQQSAAAKGARLYLISLYGE